MDAPLDDEDITQAMGFSSFGSQNRPQKRKYNPHADAIVSSDSATAQRAARPSATGSNSTPLGLATRKPDQAAANADEIDLDEDEDEDEDEDKVDGDGAASDATGIPERPGESSAPALVRPLGLPDRPPPGIGLTGSSKGHRDSHGAAQDGSRRTVEWEGYILGHMDPSGPSSKCFTLKVGQPFEFCFTAAVSFRPMEFFGKSYKTQHRLNQISIYERTRILQFSFF